LQVLIARCWKGLRDWTQASQYSVPQNLARFVASSSYRYDQSEIQAMLQELAEHLAAFRLIPLQLREFFGFVVERAHRMRNSAVVRKHGWSGRLPKHEIRVSYLLCIPGPDLRQNREIGYVFGKMVRSLRSRTLHASVQKHDISNEPEPDITKKL
jgi:hypothetical protein